MRAMVIEAERLPKHSNNQPTALLTDHIVSKRVETRAEGDESQ
jgi:hypothetical protein